MPTLNYAPEAQQDLILIEKYLSLNNWAILVTPYSMNLMSFCCFPLGNVIYFSKYYFPCSTVSCVLVQTTHPHHTESQGQRRGNYKKPQTLSVQINVLPELLHCIRQGISHFLVHRSEEICLQLNFQLNSKFASKEFARTVVFKDCIHKTSSTQ